jgi:hypothetical protein
VRYNGSFYSLAPVNTVPKQAYWTAASVATTGNVALLTDQTGRGLNMVQSNTVNQPLRTVAINGGVSTPVLRVNGNQGFVDVTGKRVLLANTDWTKMVVFIHNAATDLTGLSNYMSCWQTNAAATLWRNTNSGPIQTTSTHGNLTMEVGSTLTPTFGKWYILFQTFTAATRATDFFVNVAGTIQKITIAGPNILTNVMTSPDIELALLALVGNNAGPLCDCLEAAVWNTPIPLSAMIAEQQRLVAANPTLVWNT